MMAIGEHILTMQGHPEHRRRFTTALIEMRRAQLGPDRAAAATASLNRQTDELMVAAWITRFFAGPEIQEPIQ